MRLLLILPTNSYSTAAFMQAAEQLPVDLVVASERRQAMDEVVPGGTLLVDLLDLNAAARQIVEAANTGPFQAIVGTDDRTSHLAAMASERLGLPHNPVESVAAAGDKHLTRRILSHSLRPEIISPDYVLVSVDEQADQLASEIDYPCVLKPTFLAASRGVIRADDSGDFVAAFHRLAAMLSRPEVSRQGGSRARQLLIEQYIPGIEVALEGLLIGGRLTLLALFDKPDPLEGPSFAETIYVTPSRLDAERQRAVLETTQAAAAQLGLREGPVHAELRLNERGIWVIELAARQIGGLCSRILRFGTGTTLEDLILRHAIRCDPKHPELQPGAAGVMMLPVPRAGTLRGVEGLAAAQLVQQVEEIAITVPVNQRVEPLPEGDRYLGFIFARGPTSILVEKALRQAAEQLEIVIN